MEIGDIVIVVDSVTICDRYFYLSLVGAATSIIFVPTNRSKTTLLVTKVLSRKHYVCREKKRRKEKKKKRLSRQNYVCLDKHNFVATKVLSRRQKYCRDKYTFVATKDVLLSLQK